MDVGLPHLLFLARSLPTFIIGLGCSTLASPTYFCVGSEVSLVITLSHR